MLGTRLATSALLKPSASLIYTRVKHTEVLRWNYQNKPGKYPATMDDCAAAACRYGLHFDDYMPHDKDTIYGDYPNLPDISSTSRDLHYPWDNPDLKRNFGEPFHVDSDLYSEDRYDIDLYYKLRPSYWVQVMQFFGAMGFFWVVMIFDGTKLGHAQVPRQYPFQDKTHYSFDKC